MSRPHWVCPSSCTCAFSVYTAQAPGCSVGNYPKQALGFVHFPGLSCSDSGFWLLHQGTDSVGPAFCALHRSENLRQPGAWLAHYPRCVVHLNHLPGPGRSVSWMCCKNTISGVPFIASGELISGCNPPGRCQPTGSQEHLFSNWEPAHNLVHNVVSGAEIAPCLPALAVASLPLYLWQGDGPACSRLTLLWYSLHPLFCEQGRLCLSLVKAFPGKVLSLYFVLLSLTIPQFGLLSHVSSLRLSSGHSVPVLTLSNAVGTSLFSLCSLVVDMSGLHLHWELWLGA